MMSDCQSNMQYIPYKEIVKQKAREYYYKNKERIQEQAKNKYKSLSPEEKKKSQEYNEEWFKKQPIERQQELKEKARQYHKNRYHNLMISVKYSSGKCRRLLQLISTQLNA